jgi:hypothetical protein
VETGRNERVASMSALRPIRSPSRTGRHPKTDIDPTPSSATKGGLPTFGRRRPGQKSLRSRPSTSSFKVLTTIPGLIRLKLDHNGAMSMRYRCERQKRTHLIQIAGGML